MKCPKCDFITDVEIDYNTHLLFKHGIVRSVCKTQTDLIKQILYERIIRDYVYYRHNQLWAHVIAMNQFMNEMGYNNIPDVYRRLYDDRKKQIMKLGERIKHARSLVVKIEYQNKLIREIMRSRYNKLHARRAKVDLEEMRKEHEYDVQVCLTRFRNEYSIDNIIQEKIENPYDLMNIECKKIDDMMKDIENKVSSSIR